MHSMRLCNEPLVGVATGATSNRTVFGEESRSGIVLGGRFLLHDDFEGVSRFRTARRAHCTKWMANVHAMTSWKLRKSETIVSRSV